MNEVILSRRVFLKSFGALAAAAVVAPSMLIKLPSSDLQRLMTAMRAGIVEDQYFLFHEPITIAINNLLIRRCSFIFDCPTRIRTLITINASGLLMEGCHIDCRGAGSEFGMEILPQSTDCAVNMTSTLQSALDMLANTPNETAQTLHMAAGFYLINSPIQIPNGMKGK